MDARIRGGIWAAAGLALLYAIWPSPAGSDAEREALKQGRAIVIYWDRHFGHEHDARVALIDEYNRTQGIEDGVYVRALPIGYNVLMEKMLTSIASGSPPDICSIDSGILAQLASQGCFTPLAKWIESVPALKVEGFFPHVQDMMRFEAYDSERHEWREDVWCLPSTTDTYCLLWNKDAFRKAGLDPERPPRTTQELEEYAAKLTIHGATGVDQIGFLPWFPWDLTHMWGGLFGGQWFDPKTGLASCGTDPRIIEAYAWQQKFAINPRAADNPPYALDPAKTQSYTKLGSYMSANNPFYTGKVAMIAEGEWQVTFIPKYAPTLDWGVAPIPQPEGVEPLGYGPTCVADAVPAGAPHKEGALKFLTWFYSPRPRGGYSPISDYCKAIHNIPPRREEAMQERFTGDPKFNVYIQQLTTRPVVTYPVTPQTQFFLDKISEAREKVTFHQAAPAEAAMWAEQETNKLLRETYADMEAERQ